MDLEVFPITAGGATQLYFMIVFHELSKARLREQEFLEPHKRTESAGRLVEQLQQELEATKEFLQSVIETQEATNEELQSANEEILSSNEELQSTNEELETTKEELQSTNEELNTVNDELRARNTEVNLINNDLLNVLASIDIAIIMVSRDLLIRRFTLRAQKMLGLGPVDLGRPMWNLNPLLEFSDFQKLTLQVISSERSLEQDIQGRDGAQYQLRILPYRSAEEKVDGAVITLIEASSSHEQKEATSGSS